MYLLIEKRHGVNPFIRTFDTKQQAEDALNGISEVHSRQRLGGVDEAKYQICHVTDTYNLGQVDSFKNEYGIIQDVYAPVKKEL
jgi:hypothetical protein